MMAMLYKLTDAYGKTRAGHLNETQWGEGVMHTVTGTPKLCSPTVLHAYTSPLLAELLDPIHASFGPKGKLWEAEGEIVVESPDKVGCQTLTTTREIKRPAVTTNQRVRFAILVAQAVLNGRCPKWQTWAAKWLSGKDRSAAYSYAAAYAAANAANAATNAAYSYAAYATTDAAYAAAYAAANAANAATNAAYSYAAYAATNAAANLDLVKLAEQAVRDEQ